MTNPALTANELRNQQLILVVEDEAKLASVLTDYLSAAGYEVLCEADGLQAEMAVRLQKPDLILLDLNLPGRDGVDICRDIRSFTDTPIVMMTARTEEIDRLLGLEVGADDYICKPFSPREVVARVKAILRRAGLGTMPSPLIHIALDESGQRVSFHGKWLDLTAVEFRLFRAMVRAPGRIFSRDQLLDNIYTDNRLVSDRTIDSHVKNLRRKLHKVSPDHEIVRSVYGVGYKVEP
jgi:two-component system response regulator BaeR